MELPKVTQEPINHVDATPDEGYPIRILESYRENCKCRWVISGIGISDAEKALWDIMNADQEKRAEILDRAINILKSAMGKK